MRQKRENEQLRQQTAAADRLMETEKQLVYEYQKTAQELINKLECALEEKTKENKRLNLDLLILRHLLEEKKE